MRLTAITLVALLAACGGSDGGPATQDDCGTPLVVYVNLAPTLVVGPLGETDRCATYGTQIWVLDALQGDSRLPRVIAHELGHAAGLHHDFDHTGCLMDQAVPPNMEPPCAQEVAALAGFTLTLTVHAGPGLYDATLHAATTWNNALGRVVFDVQ